MDTKEAFRMRFRTARKELGLSQTEAATLIGVSRTIVSDWEQGRSSPSMDKFSSISLALKKPIVYFFSVQDNPDQFGVSNEDFVRSLAKTAKQFRVLQTWLTKAAVAVGSAVQVLNLLAMSEAALHPNLEDELFDLKERLFVSPEAPAGFGESRVWRYYDADGSHVTGEALRERLRDAGPPPRPDSDEEVSDYLERAGLRLEEVQQDEVAHQRAQERASHLRKEAVSQLGTLERFLPSVEDESLQEQLFGLLSDKFFREFLTPAMWEGNLDKIMELHPDYEDGKQ